MKKNITIGVLVVVIGLVGYVIIRDGKVSTQDNQQIPTAQLPQTALPDTYQFIPEWGLKYKVTDENKDIYYRIETHLKSDTNLATYVSLDLYSKKLQDKQQFGVGGFYVSITRFDHDPRLGADKQIRDSAVKKIGSYYYWNGFESQAPCPHFSADGKVDINYDPVCGAELSIENQVFNSLEAQ